MVTSNLCLICELLRFLSGCVNSSHGVSAASRCEQAEAVIHSSFKGQAMTVFPLCSSHLRLKHCKTKQKAVVMSHDGTAAEMQPKHGAFLCPNDWPVPTSNAMFASIAQFLPKLSCQFVSKQLMHAFFQIDFFVQM